MPEQKRTRSEIKREAIIEAAKSAFRQFGVKATSMDKLAEMAQVSKRTVYNHFATKEGLVMYLLTEQWNTSMVKMEAQYSIERDLSSQLIRLLRAEIEFLGGQDYIELSRVAISHFFYHPDALIKEVEKLALTDTALYQWLGAAASGERLVGMDIDIAFEQLHNLIKGSCFWPQLINLKPLLSDAQKDQLAEQTATMFLSQYEK